MRFGKSEQATGEVTATPRPNGAAGKRGAGAHSRVLYAAVCRFKGREPKLSEGRYGALQVVHIKVKMLSSSAFTTHWARQEHCLQVGESGKGEGGDRGLVLNTLLVVVTRCM